MKFRFLNDFRDFAVKGNVIDMAVGVIIGGAFGKIVSSLVSDIIMPLVGLILGGVNLVDLKWVLKPETLTDDGLVSPAIILSYGKFIQTAFDFIVIAFSIFVFLRVLSYMRLKGKALMEKKKAEKDRLESLSSTEENPSAEVHPHPVAERKQEQVVTDIDNGNCKDGKSEEVLLEIRDLLKKMAEKS